MLFVLFHLGPERYALDAQRVVEVVPLLALKKLAQAPRGVAGMFIYRGRPVPALDLCELTLGRPAVEHLSTRIIIVNHSSTDGEEQLVGLIAERATEILRRDEKEFADASARPNQSAFLGALLTDAQGMIQVVSPEKLVQESLRAELFAAATEVRNAAR